MIGFWKDSEGGGMTMGAPAHNTRMPSRYYEVVRVALHCPETATHTRVLTLEHATLYPNGWASWVEGGHVYVGYVQAGPCCSSPQVDVPEDR